MIEIALLTPSFLVAIENNKNDNSYILRDLVLLLIVTQIYLLGFPFPLKLYRFFAAFVIASEIINNLLYRIIPPNQQLKQEWLNLQKRETQELLKTYLKKYKKE
jgi:cell division protein FtsW (lipid II flippase)